MDYYKLNETKKKDHFSLPLIDQMLDRLAGKKFFCFLNDYSGYNHIKIATKDQHKIMFTCPHDTFAFRRIPFGLYIVSGTFQRYTMAIFSDFLESLVKIFINDFFSILGLLQRMSGQFGRSFIEI